MKKANSEAIAISRYIFSFFSEFAPIHKTSSEHTLKSYSTAITLFLEFLETSEKVSPETLNHVHFERVVVEKWLQWLKTERGCSSATCNVRLGSLRVFLKYLGSRNPEFLHLSFEATVIPLMKTRKTKVCGMPKKAVKALMACPNQKTKIGIRDLVIMIILYATACRINELLSIKNGQLHLSASKPYVNVIGKGNKVRTLYLLPKAEASIKVYLSLFHGSHPDPEAYLFYSRCKSINSQLTQPAVDKRLKLIAKEAYKQCLDVPLGLHAHQFRHAKASHWLEDGMNIVQISFLLGHENLTTTMKYLDITLEDEAKALATLEDEKSKKTAPKWKNKDGSLKSFCGMK